jgi:hypothetical protein
MLHAVPNQERLVLEEGLISLVIGFLKAWALAILAAAVFLGILEHLLGGSGIELAIDVVTVAAPPFILAQVQLMLVVGFVLYLSVISYRDLHGIQPSYLTNKLYTKILESGRRWMSLVFGDIRILHLPNMTSRWFAYPERAANQGTRYLPGDSPQLE